MLLFETNHLLRLLMHDESYASVGHVDLQTVCIIFDPGNFARLCVTPPPSYVNVQLEARHWS